MTDLDKQVRAGLEAHRGHWPQIAQTCDVSHSWISQFIRGLIPNPGYKTLLRIYAEIERRERLTDKP